MWVQFLLENIHFTVNVLATLVSFAIFWLYLDTIYVRKSPFILTRLGGFFLLSLSFIASGVSVESTLLSVGLSSSIFPTIVLGLRIGAYLLLLASLLGEPLQPRPKYIQVAAWIPMAGVLSANMLMIFLPIGAVLVAYLYLRRATIGLEDHIKPVSLGFYVLSLSEFFGLALLYRETSNPVLYRYVAPFGILWILQLGMLTLALIILGRWVFAYLFKQFQTQLFMIFTIVILIVYLVTSFTFTGFLVANIRSESMERLKTDVRVLDYIFAARASESLSISESIAVNPDIIDALLREDKNQLRDLALRYVNAKNEASLVITREDGQIVARGENPERIGDSLSSDPLVRRAIAGTKATTIVTQDSVLAPVVWIKAAAPVIAENRVIGTVISGNILDSAFVDGMKKTTGLDAVLYAGNKISASTIIDAESQSRLIGVAQEDQHLKTTVLIKGLKYNGSITFNNQPHFGAFTPLLDVDGNAVGMLAVIRPESSVIAAAGKSIELTFLVTAVLLVFSVYPAFLISRFLTKQIRI